MTDNTLSSARERTAWRLYDFANSAFPTIIITAIYVSYFKNVVVVDAAPGESDRLWGMANSIGAAIVFLSAPLLGTVADLSGRKRVFLFSAAGLCIAGTAALSLTGPGTVVMAMLLFIAALVGFELSCVIYNAFLSDLVPPEQMDRLSGSGWATGYVGGLGALALCIPVAVFLPEQIGKIPLVVALWFALFSIPAFVWLKDRPVRHPVEGNQLSAGFSRLSANLKKISSHRNFLRFLIAYFFYENATATIIVFAVAFAGDSLHFSLTENIALIAVMNIVAAPGAFAFGRVAEKIGARRTIVITLWMWLLVVAGAEIAAWPGLFDVDGAKMFFWGVAVLASLCIGAVQATSRSFVGQVAPQGQGGEFFGFLAFAGKGSAVIGPLVFGIVSQTFASQRAAVLSIGIFFLVGLVLMRWVKDPERL